MLGEALGDHILLQWDFFVADPFGLVLQVGVNVVDDFFFSLLIYIGI